MADLPGAMDILLANVMEELAKDVADPGLCMAAVFPGEQVPADYGADSTCKGQLFVRLATAHPSTRFPNPDVSLEACYSTLAYPLEVGLYRKAPVAKTPMGARLVLPKADEHRNAARQQYKDLQAMHRAIQRLREDVEDLVIGTYLPVGPEGGLVGGLWTLTIGVD